MRFQNKIVLITGSGSERGIGQATAVRFAQEGAKVVLNSEKITAESYSVKKLQEMGVDFHFVKCDIRDEEQVKSMIDEVCKKYGKIDILVNNAGIVYDKPMMEKTVEEWQNTLNVNLIGTFLCSKYAAPKMPKGGKIVNTASTNGVNNLSTESADYDASKAGIISLTHNLAAELGPDINVNAVSPGWVDTQMNDDLPKDFIDEEMKQTFLGRMGRPEEIAGAITFLASEDASYITGANIMIDGGRN